MKRIFFTSAILVAIAAPAAFAADLPAAPAYKVPPMMAPAPFSWTGFYVGGNVGGAWGRSETDSPLANIACGICYIPSVVADINAQRAVTLNGSAVTGGLQAGFNAQFGALVLGAEADINSFRLTRTNVVSAAFTGFPVPAGGVAPTYTNSFSTSWLATFRGRVGFASNNWLVYATGGGAATNFSYTHTYAEGVFPGTSSGVETSTVSGTRTGYTVGGGAEVAMGNWSIKGEYLYLDFGSVSSTAPVIFPPAVVGGSTFTHTANLRANVARLGLNYRFGGPGGY